jgi:hypothetical protein
MTRLAVVLIVVALSGCGAEAATTRTVATTTPMPPPHPTKVSKACLRLPAPLTTSNALPSMRVLGALGVLRRPRAADDALPAKAFALNPPFVAGVMADSARRVQLPDGTDEWVVPAENLAPPIRVPEACLRTMPADQRKATREAIEDSENQPAVEGVVIVRDRDGEQPRPGQSWRIDDIVAGKAFSLQGCTGPMHNRITLSGLVPDAVTQVTVTAKNGAMVQVSPEQNVITLEQDRPDKPSGLPAHITSTTGAAPLEYALDPRSIQGLDRPCEPPSSKSIGKRREPPTRLRSPNGARIELQTRRWQPEDTGPSVAGATYRDGSRRCLLVASEKRLRAGRSAHRFCVEGATLKAERYVVRATRLPGGDVILEGFVDPEQLSWLTVERTSLAPGAFRLPTAKRSGAFFIAIHGKHASGGTFSVHAVVRGPFRYTALRTVRLNSSP